MARSLRRGDICFYDFTKPDKTRPVVIINCLFKLGKSKTQMSQAKQRRMDDLLFRNREGDLNLDEKNELEAQLLMIAKAQRLLKKSHKR